MLHSVRAGRGGLRGADDGRRADLEPTGGAGERRLLLPPTTDSLSKHKPGEPAASAAGSPG
jgi:hypothetical protein